MSEFETLVNTCMASVSVPEGCGKLELVLGDIVKKTTGHGEDQLQLGHMLDAVEDLGEVLVRTKGAQGLDIAYVPYGFSGTLVARYENGVAVIDHAGKKLQLQFFTDTAPFQWHSPYSGLLHLAVTSLVRVFQRSLESAARFREGSPTACLVCLRPTVVVRTDTFPAAELTVILSLAAEV